MKSKIIVLISGLLTLSACEKRPKAPAVGEQIILAQVDDRRILKEEFLGVVERLEERTPLRLTTYPQRRELLDQMINMDLLAEAALKKGFDSRFEFKSRLADAYVEDLALQARKSLTDEVLRREYLKNKKEYDQISARHILFALPKGRSTSDSERNQKRSAAERALEQLKREPDSFPNLARQLSEDPSARQGGEIGFFTFSQLDPNFSEAAFALTKIGQISPVVRSDFGYHIIQLTGDKRGFEHHKESLRAILIRQVQKDILKAEIDRLRSEKKIEVYESNLNSITPLPAVMSQDPKTLIEEKDGKE